MLRSIACEKGRQDLLEDIPLAKVGRGRSTPFSPYGMNSFGPVLEENFGKETAPMDTRRGEPADAAQPDEICVAAPRAGLRAFGRRGASRRQTDNRAGRLAPVPQRRGKGNHLPTITRIFRRRLAPGWGVRGGEPASETQSRRSSCSGAPRAACRSHSRLTGCLAPCQRLAHAPCQRLALGPAPRARITCLRNSASPTNAWWSWPPFARTSCRRRLPP